MNEGVISDSAIGSAYMYFHWDCDFNITDTLYKLLLQQG